jgi:hypothetical protein
VGGFTLRFAFALICLVTPALAATDTVPLVQERAAALHAAARLPREDAETEFKRPGSAIATMLANLRPAEARVRGSLTIVPLVAQAAQPLPPLEDAAGAVWAIDGAGAYQKLQAQGAVRLALLGQVLQGDKTQDRTVERTMIVPPGGEAEVAAYCCEEKFVARAGERLDMTARLVPGAARVKMALALRQELEPLWRAAVVNRGFAVQHDVWREISSRIGAAGIASKHLAFLDLVPARPAELGAFAAQPLPAGTVGIAVGVGDKLVAVECLGDAQAMGRWAPELIASWADLGWASPPPAQPQAVESALAGWLGAAPGVESLVPQDGAVTVAVRSPRAQGLGTTVRGAVAHLLLIP